MQSVEPAVEPAFDLAYAEGEMLARARRALGLTRFDGPGIRARVSRAIGAAVPAFAGIDVDSVGDEGLPLRGAGA